MAFRVGDIVNSTYGKGEILSIRNDGKIAFKCLMMALLVYGHNYISVFAT